MNSGLILRDAVGRALASTLPPTDFNGGTPTSGAGVLSVIGVNTPIAAYVGGLPYDAQGRLCIVANLAVPVDSHAPGGIPMANGRVAVAQGAAVASYLLGLPLSATGRLVGAMAP